MSRRERPLCRKAACKRTSYAGGLCHRHYDEKRRAKEGKQEKERAAGEQKSGPAISPVSSAGDRPATTAKKEPSLKTKKEERGCGVPDCTQPHHAKGYCKVHYARLRRYGDPLAAGPRKSGSGRARKGASSGKARLLLIRERHAVLKQESERARADLLAETGKGTE